MLNTRVPTLIERTHIKHSKLHVLPRSQYHHYRIVTGELIFLDSVEALIISSTVHFLIYEILLHSPTRRTKQRGGDQRASCGAFEGGERCCLFETREHVPTLPACMHL